MKDPGIDASAERLAQIAAAKQQFLSTAINMSWQLALTIIVPVVIGVELDNHYHTSPSWALAGLFLGVFMSCGVVVKTLKQVKVNQSQSLKKDGNVK